MSDLFLLPRNVDLYIIILTEPLSFVHAGPANRLRQAAWFVATLPPAIRPYKRDCSTGAFLLDTISALEVRPIHTEWGRPTLNF